MKYQILLFFWIAPLSLFSQNLQIHYDLRHTFDRVHTAKNFPSIYFEYFKSVDSGKCLLKPGSFLLKIQADLQGEKNNMGQVYFQTAQTIRFWKPAIFLHLSYSGGLGVTEPRQYSYYINNALSLGLAYPFHWQKTWLTTVLDYKYVSFPKPSWDFLYTLYWWKGLLNFKMEFSGDFSIWTENKNHGDDFTRNLKGKRFFFFAEPQVWFKVHKCLYLGSKVNMYYHIYISDNLWEAYPTLAIKFKL
jgi:hypothetical protein